MGLTRRLFLGGMLAGTAAPEIVRASIQVITTPTGIKTWR